MYKPGTPIASVSLALAGPMAATRDCTSRTGAAGLPRVLRSPGLDLLTKALQQGEQHQQR